MPNVFCGFSSKWQTLLRKYRKYSKWLAEKNSWWLKTVLGRKAGFFGNMCAPSLFESWTSFLLSTNINVQVTETLFSKSDNIYLQKLTFRETHNFFLLLNGPLRDWGNPLNHYFHQEKNGRKIWFFCFFKF